MSEPLTAALAAPAPVDAASVCARIEAVGAELAALVRDLDVSAFGADESVRLLGAWARVGRAASSGQAVAATRVDHLGAAHRRGHRTTQDLVAAQAGTSWAAANRVVETARGLTEPTASATAAALRAGRISVEQAHAVQRAVAVVPAAEGELLALARTTGLRGLQRRARDLRLTVELNAPGAYQRMVDAQSLTWRTDDAGMWAGEFRLPPDVGAGVASVLEAQADRHFRAASKDERHARPHRWWRAEALASLVTGREPAELRTGTVPPATSLPPGREATGAAPDPPRAQAPRPPAPPRPQVVFHVSYDAYRRGRVEAGEVCALEGVGPVPLERVHEVVGDAFVKAVLLQGTEVTRVRHFGRHLPAEVRTALGAEAMARDGTVQCSWPGCDATLGLEWDHRRPLAHGGATEKQHLGGLCRLHHREKTRRERRGQQAEHAGRDP